MAARSASAAGSARIIHDDPLCVSVAALISSQSRNDQLRMGFAPTPAVVDIQPTLEFLPNEQSLSAVELRNENDFTRPFSQHIDAVNVPQFVLLRVSILVKRQPFQLVNPHSLIAEPGYRTVPDGEEFRRDLDNSLVDQPRESRVDK